MVEQGNKINESAVYEIYQLKEDMDDDLASRLFFQSYDSLKKNGISVDSDNYDLVWTDKWNGESMSALFEMFNLRHPAGFEGHSMSVSDVIVFKDSDGIAAFYVDRWSFEPVEGFFDNAVNKGLER